jgi:hypothetical protein
MAKGRTCAALVGGRAQSALTVILWEINDPQVLVQPLHCDDIVTWTFDRIPHCTGAVIG